MSTKQLKIRNAEIEDLSTILDLNLRLFNNDSQYDPTLNCDWTKTEEGKEYFRARIQEDDGCTFVALVNETIVGYLVGDLKESGSYRGNLKIAQLENMFVLEGSRSQNVGKRLCQEFNVWAKDKSADRLQVVASAGNQRAIEFYQKNGFQDYDVTLEMKI